MIDKGSRPTINICTKASISHNISINSIIDLVTAPWRFPAVSLSSQFHFVFSAHHCTNYSCTRSHIVAAHRRRFPAVCSNSAERYTYPAARRAGLAGITLWSNATTLKWRSVTQTTGHVSPMNTSRLWCYGRSCHQTQGLSARAKYKKFCG